MGEIGLGVGIYTPREASRLAGVRPERIRRWLLGYKFRTRTGTGSTSGPVFQPDWPVHDSRMVLSFLDLIEILFVRAFLKHGVSMATIRRAATEGAEYFNVSHPFCVKQFVTDGRAVLVRIQDEHRDEHLVDLVRRQAVFGEVFSPLLRQLDYDVASAVARQWWPRGRGFPVLLDPARALGEPIEESRSIPTRILAGPVAAGDSLRKVAEWFEVSPRHVRAAVKFEDEMNG